MPGLCKGARGAIGGMGTAVVLFSAALAATKAPAIASETWLLEAELREAFTGVTLDGKYGSGKPFTESYGRDGRIEYRERGTIIAGKWSILSGSLCTIYDTDPTGGCYRVKKVGSNCYEFYFVARTEQQARTEQGRPAWTARGSVQGRDGTCAEQHSV